MPWNIIFKQIVWLCTSFLIIVRGQRDVVVGGADLLSIYLCLYFSRVGDIVLAQWVRWLINIFANKNIGF